MRGKRFGVVVSALVALNLVVVTIGPFLTERAVDPAADGARETVVTLRRLASDNGAFEASGEPQWVIDDGSGGSIPVADANGLPEGSRLVVDSLEDVAASGSVDGARPIPGVTAAAVAKPLRRLLVVPMQWGGQTWTSTDSTDMKTLIDRLVPWWSTMSAGRERLEVTTTPVLDGNATFKAGECDETGMRDATIAHAEKLGLSKSYDHLMVTFPNRTVGCAWGGLGYMPGTFTWTKLTAEYAFVWAHELGHNLGLPHGNLCRSASTVSYMANCTDGEYGNRFDVMGSSARDMATAYFSPSFLRTIDWLPDANLRTWNGTQTNFTIMRADRTDLGATAVAIGATDASAGDNEYWLQYNPEPGEYYNPRVSVPLGGVVLTMTPSKKFSSGRVVNPSTGAVGSANSNSYLCDVTPSAEFRWDDPRILPGASFTDPRNRFKITVVSADGTKAEVRVEPVTPVVVGAPAAVTALADPEGLRAIKVDVSWTTPGVNEPTGFVVDTLEDPARSCSVDVFSALSCTLTGLARGATYTTRVVAVNGAARSSPVVAAPVTIQNSPPAFDVSIKKDARSLVASVTVDDGGSPLTTAPVLTLSDGRSCALSPTALTMCPFDNLLPRTQYVLTASAANALGPRETRQTVRTSAAKPIAPKLVAEFAGDDLVLTGKASALDATNVTHFNFYCDMDRKWRGPVPMDPATLSASVTVPGVKGTDGWCWTMAIATDQASGMGGLQTMTSVSIGERGNVVVRRITLTVSATSKSKGKVSVKWTAKDTAGRATVTVRAGKGRRCAPKTSTSCVVRGLRTGGRLTILVTAKGPSGTTFEKRVVTVR